MMRIVLVLAMFLTTTSASAHDSAEANKLMVEAVEANKLMVEAIMLVDAVEKEPSAEVKYNLLRKALENLTAIVERFPSTDLAVNLASGQRIGKISLEKVRKALNEVALARPRRPGAPVRVWRHRSRIIAATFLRRKRHALTVGVDGIATVRNIRTGKILYKWRHGVNVTAAAVSRDRRRILTAGADRNAALRIAEREGSWSNGGLEGR